MHLCAVLDVLADSDPAGSNNPDTLGPARYA